MFYFLTSPPPPLLFTLLILYSLLLPTMEIVGGGIADRGKDRGGAGKGGVIVG